jgi:hypothetical protein
VRDLAVSRNELKRGLRDGREAEMMPSVSSILWRGSVNLITWYGSGEGRNEGIGLHLPNPEPCAFAIC